MSPTGLSSSERGIFLRMKVQLSYSIESGNMEGMGSENLHTGIQ